MLEKEKRFSLLQREKSLKENVTQILSYQAQAEDAESEEKEDLVKLSHQHPNPHSLQPLPEEQLLYYLMKKVEQMYVPKVQSGNSSKWMIGQPVLEMKEKVPFVRCQFLERSVVKDCYKETPEPLASPNICMVSISLQHGSSMSVQRWTSKHLNGKLSPKSMIFMTMQKALALQLKRGKAAKV